MSYWDTSALGKLYVQESDSGDFERKAESVAVIVTSSLARLEMHRIAFRKEIGGQIPAQTAEEILRQLDQDIASGDIRIVTIDPAVEAAFGNIMAACYRQPAPIPLRTFDALHLASARVAGETEIVATDKTLRTAATHLGFSVYPL